MIFEKISSQHGTAIKNLVSFCSGWNVANNNNGPLNAVNNESDSDCGTYNEFNNETDNPSEVEVRKSEKKMDIEI